MLFTSLAFFIFFAITLLVYYLVPKKIQWIILLLASAFFYASFSWKFLFFVIATVITIYFGARYISNLSKVEEQKLQSENLDREAKKAIKNAIKKKKKLMLTFVIVFNIGILAVLKYGNFFIFNFQSLMELFGWHQHSLMLNLILPLGISFYTFQSVGYLVDVYWGKVQAQQNIFKLALFVSYFPQMIEGPISRYGDLWDKELSQQHRLEYENLARGVLLILWGLFKKLVIADGLYLSVDVVFSDPFNMNGAQSWLGIIFYFIQDYADFSGCIDIALGVSQCFGIKLPQNFNHPYFSRTIPEYWRRWHITLGTWFKDYIFYPLSLSKFSMNLGKKAKKLMKNFGKMVPGIVGLILVWFITGLWHGASWTYILWGLYYGFIIILGVVFEPVYSKLKEKWHINDNAVWYRIFQWFRTILILIVGRVIFRAVSLDGAFAILGSLFDFANYNLDMISWQTVALIEPSVIVALVSSLILLAVDIWQEFHQNTTVRQALIKHHIVIRYAVYIVLLLFVLIFGCYGPSFTNIDFEYMKF